MDTVMNEQLLLHQDIFLQVEGIGVLCIATLQRFITNIIIFKLILNEWSVD